ncbi:MAG: oligosaccharide flippase family protein [Clostridia bacterium]|nr:oligosaccharide flippase family protein [Clostridia bacterium]
MNRITNIKNNLIFNTIKFATQLVLQFILRTALIYYMGAEYLGLNGLFTNIFSFLNLAELGIGSAIVFSMYKPIAEGDTEKVKALQTMYKKTYLIISLVVFVLGISILPFIKVFINGDVTVDVNIYVLYILYLIQTLVGYFSAHKRSLLFAHQRNDVENKVSAVCLLGMTVLQIIVLFAFKNYYIYFSINILFTIIECLLIYIQTNKLYPHIKGPGCALDVDTKKEIYKNVRAISLHKIGGAVVFSTDNILISSMLGLVVLGAYSNYYLIISTLTTIYFLFTNAIKGSVGNLIASTDKEYVYSKYRQTNFLFTILTSFCVVCMIVLFQPFISVWTKHNSIYLLDFYTVVLLCISFYLGKMRMNGSIYRECAGLFNQNKLQPLIESIVNLVASIVLGYYMGLNGIILGTIISTLIAPIWWEPLILFKYYFKKSVWQYFKGLIIDTIITGIVCLVCYFVCSFIPDGTLIMLVCKFAVCVPLAGILLLLFYLPFKDCKNCVSMFMSAIKNFKNRKSQNKNEGVG